MTPSCAHWLHWQCGIGLGAAREKLRVAHALESLPRISESMSCGEISYAKVRAVTRVADAGNEEVWLDVARNNTAHRVEKLVTQYREALEVAELTREARQQASRTVRCHWDRDGSLVIRARLPAEAGALVLKAQQIIVHVDAATLATDAPGRCELEEGPSIAAETARRLACDASLVTIVEDERSEPLSVDRRTRAIPPAVRRALAARDKGCRVPGFTRPLEGSPGSSRPWSRP